MLKIDELPPGARKVFFSVGEVVLGVLVIAGVIAIVGAGLASMNLDGEDEIVEVDDSHRTCRELLDALPITEETNHGSYSRELFGEYDRAALLEESKREYGAYVSRWDGKKYEDPGRVEVDHLVPLAEAWSSGAWDWEPDTLAEFGGDVRNLTLLTAELNQEKGASDPAEWLPPAANGDVQYSYVRRWVAVKTAYNLTIDAAEREALLPYCGGS